ncbi:MAG TPA: TonB family protein [Pyrinomonadaceae bacterium]|nr:TonB family protein [Pyrinomonadaceae bacterium]
MKTFILVLLALFVSNAFFPQASPESPELKEAADLAKSVVGLFNEQKFDEALVAAKRALEIRERLLPRTDPRVVQSLGHVGDLYLSKRDYDNARKLFERLLLIQEERFGPTDVNLAFVCDRLAVLYNRDGKPAKAEELYQRALAAREKAFGPEHVQVADTLYALAQFYRHRREYDRALASYKRSLMIYGRAGGVTTAGFGRASTGLSCLGYESQNTAIFKELEEIQKQFAPALPVVAPAEILNGRAVSLAKPDYPAAARDMRLSGSVIVHVKIDEQGKVTSAKDACQGLPYLSESSVKAALKSRFSPTKLSGVPVKVKGVIRYNFVAR